MSEWTERFSLKGRRALVTGASKGIGSAIATVLADAGADVVITARDDDGLAEAKAAILAKGRKVHVIKADLASESETQAAGAEAVKVFGGIDILVNNAGIALVAPLLDTTVEGWDRIMAVNLRAPFLMAQAVAPGMIARRSGKIINVSSQSGVVGLVDHSAYCASKGGLNQLTRVMAIEWSPHNIQINAVCPTVILTPMGEKVWGPPEKGGPMLEKIPLGRFGKPVEVADMVLYLASPASDLVTGQSILIDGGFTAL